MSFIDTVASPIDGRSVARSLCQYASKPAIVLLRFSSPPESYRLLSALHIYRIFIAYAGRFQSSPLVNYLRPHYNKIGTDHLSMKYVLGGLEMAVLDGCEAEFKTPVPEERICPQCGKEMEVFTVKGRVVEDAVCECGYVIKAQDPDSPMVKKTED